MFHVYTTKVVSSRLDTYSEMEITLAACSRKDVVGAGETKRQILQHDTSNNPS
jgi:hypothetical protein